jgi:hypothetical protein
MSAELPPDIVIVENGPDTCYVLPRPALGIARVMGGTLTAFGLGPIAMGVWFMREMNGHLGAANGPFVIGRLLSGLCPSVFILFGGLISLLGVWLLAGRSEIILTAEVISSGLRLGPLVWRGWRPRRLVRRLVVERSSRGSGPGADLASLFAETDAGRPLLLAFFYSADWLTPLAADLARRWDALDNPLPVLQRATGQAASRRWRRDRPPEGRRPIPSGFLFVWGGGFFAGGVFFFVLILQALVRGDPGGNLQGAYPWKCLWALFPLPFIVPGALALLHLFRRRKTAGLSPEQLKSAEAKPPAPVDEAGVVAPGRTPPETEYPTVPPVDHAPGAELPVRLSSGDIGGWGVLIILGVVLLCSGILTPVATYAINQVRAGHFDEGTTAAGFFTLFLGLPWVLLMGALVKEYRRWRLGYPVVEVSALPLYCGDACEVVVTVNGPVTLPRLWIAVVCEESVSYTEGSESEKATRRVHEQELALRENFTIEAGDPFRVRGLVHIPAGAMHSFKAVHNEVRWLVRVEGDAQRFFRLPFTHDYRLEVRPRPDSGEAT